MHVDGDPDQAVLLLTERKGRPFPGRTFWSYMFLYGVSRFAIEFYRGDALNSNSFEANALGLEKGHLVGNNFGFAIGGPII